jgi:NAD(P)H-dependent FMN reductase
MQPKIELAMILGSARAGRFCDTVARWAAAEIRRSGRYELDTLDPAGAKLYGGSAAGGLAFPADFRPRLARADAFVVVTPEYNHSYPAPLKALIDSAKDEWHAKPVAFVSYGGLSGGLRAVEHLRHVFAELHAVGIRDGVSFSNAWERFDAEGNVRDPDAARRAAATMLSRLAWWATALRQARDERAYAEAAA